MIRITSKFFFVLLFCLQTFIGYSQENFQIEWTSPIYSQERNSYLLSFSGAVYENPNPELPLLVLNFDGVNISSFTLSNKEYQPLTEEEILLLPKERLTDSINIDIRAGIKRKKNVSIVSLVPIHFNSNTKQFEKLVRFSYTYTHKKAIARNQASARQAAGASSVLSEGNWYKLRIGSTTNWTGSGIYKIDYDLLKSMIGSRIDNIDVKQIQLFGNGGGMLPEANSAFKYNDLQENAIYISGDADGKFDKGDYILFYGQGPDSWKYDTSKSIYKHIKNIYSDYSFYFLTIGNSNGKRVAVRSDSGNVAQNVTQYPEHLFYEKDEFNLLKSGRTWYGDIFETTTKKDFPFPINGLIENGEITVSTAVMAQSKSASSFDITVNGTKYNLTIGSSALEEYGSKGNEVYRDIKISGISPGTENLVLNYNYNKTSSSGFGLINYCEINYIRELVFSGSQINFRSKAFNGLSQFVVGNISDRVVIWDVTTAINPEIMPYSIDGGNGIFSSNTSINREFIAFQGSDFLKPTYVGEVKNQDLHGLTTGNIPDLIIVTTKELLPAANELAQFRSSHDKLDVIVATTEEIYNEFSSGAQDLVAIRNFVKMFYDKNTASDSLSYLLLFGAGSYDYKDRIEGNSNLVPVYETPESLNNISSQSSDDYCGFLDDIEGDWENTRVVHYLDIGIGRLGVRNLEEAKQVVKKLIHYSAAPETLGKWRNKICIVSDNKDPGFIHLNDAESLASTIAVKNPKINVNKLYMDAFPLVSAPSGQICPTIKDALMKEINKGTFIVNYSGHGSEYIWAQENIIDMEDITGLKNLNNLPFFITATCEFGRYDNPLMFSGASSLTLNPEGGAIGILTSTRPVYAYSNVTINKAFYNEVFNFQGKAKPRLGTIMMNTKNNSIIGYNNRNYALLGDPSLMLAYPEKEVVITQINNKPASSSSDTLNALNKITLSGEVRENDQVLSSFNGKINVSIYDKPSTIVTSSSTFQVQNNMIFDGIATVVNGKFSLSFIVSKDISYTFGAGKISLYSDDSTLTDAVGSYINIIIGGNGTNVILDTIPPNIKLYIGDESFVQGGIASPNTFIIAKLSDSSGINISNASIGHEIIGVINDSKNVIIMNDFYSSEQDDYKNGTLTYPLNNLSPGNYTIKIKAWDTYNNSNIQSIDFVVPENTFLLNRVMNFPNPFSQTTTISFEHNRSGEDIETSILIYSVNGDLVKTIESKILSSPTRVTSLTWDGRDELGNIVSRGMYIAKLNVSVPKDGSQETKHIKLIVLN